MIFIELPIIAEKEEHYIVNINPASIHSITEVEDHCIVVYGPQGKPLEVEMLASTLLAKLQAL